MIGNKVVPKSRLAKVTVTAHKILHGQKRHWAVTVTSIHIKRNNSRASFINASSLFLDLPLLPSHGCYYDSSKNNLSNHRYRRIARKPMTQIANPVSRVPEARNGTLMIPK